MTFFSVMFLSVLFLLHFIFSQTGGRTQNFLFMNSRMCLLVLKLLSFKHIAMLWWCFATTTAYLYQGCPLVPYLVGSQSLLLAFHGVSFKGGMNNSTVWHTAILQW